VSQLRGRNKTCGDIMENSHSKPSGSAWDVPSIGFLAVDNFSKRDCRRSNSAIAIGGNVYLTQREAADYLRLSPRTLERFRVSGSGPRFTKAGRRVLYRIDELDKWTAARTFTSTAEAQSGALGGGT